MSKEQEIKKLKERIEELEFVKDFQQDMIAQEGFIKRFVRTIQSAFK
jgi:cell fate (sporulation/competence/biofilm development) regulator YmcA (YheA/YmcA/DUF963 family)